MSDRPTPETDAAISVGLENADRECVPADFARRLERERNELLAYLDADHYATCNAELRKKRDSARDELAALKRTAHWLYSRLRIYLDGNQFIGTAQRLERVGEENPWMKEPYNP